MKERIRSLHENRIFSLLVWLIAIFVAIVMMPTTTNLIQEYGQPQLSNTSQPMVSRAIQNNWGRNISGTYNVTAVFNNPSGKLTTAQQLSIDKTVQRLTDKEKLYGIKSIQTLETNPTAKSQFYSKDQSTEIVQLALDRNQGDLRVLTQQLQNQIKTNGLNSYVTSPEIINDASNEKISQATNLATIIGFILSLLIIGIIFKSLIAPLISTLSMLMMYAVSMGLVNNLVTRANFPYSEYMPLLMLMLTLILGTLGHFYLFRAFKQHLEAGDSPRDATTESIRDNRYFLGMICLILTLIFAGFWLFKFSTLRAISGLAIVTIIIVLGCLTIAPIFLSLLGERFFWPAVDTSTSEHQLWNRLGRFGLWQPFVAIIAVLYIVGPFAFVYRNNLNFSAVKTVPANNQAVTGMRVLNAHFGEGTATPVTIYVQSTDRVDNERALLQLDNLTTKLQSMSGVASVTSLTQPNGQPINEYYVNNQLNNMNMSLKGATDQLSTIQSELKSNRSDLSAVKLTEEADKIDTLVSRADQLSSDTSTVESQVSQIAGRASVSQQSTASAKVRRYQRLLSLINTQLQTVASNMRALGNQVSTSQSETSSVQSNVSGYATQLSAIETSLKKSSASLGGLIKSYTDIYSYLTALQASDAAKVYYITPEQLTSMQFQQSLLSNTSQNYKTTKLTVYLTDSAAAKNPSATLEHLQQEVNTQLQGTSLAGATIAYTGQPVVQDTIRQSIKDNAIGLTALIVGVLLFMVALISRSVLQPLYWLMAYGLSFAASFQLAQLTNHFMTGDADFNWQVPLIAFVPVIVLGTYQLVELGLSYRFNDEPMLDWLLPGVTALGQTVRHYLFAILVLCLVLFTTGFNPLTQAGLIVGFTAIIFNLILPIIVTAVGKLTITLPAKKPRQSHHLLKRRSKKNPEA